MKYKSYKDMSREELLKELDKNLENRCRQGVKVARLDNQHMTICNELARRNALNLKH
jgi:hypothetical protein